jgi:hypothetical protein
MNCLRCGKEVEEHGNWWSCTVCDFEWWIDPTDGWRMEYRLGKNREEKWYDTPEGCLAVFKETEL